MLDYEAKTNFSMAVPYEDEDSSPLLPDGAEKDERYKDLLASEVSELRNTWAVYTKKIMTVLVILPQEILNRYD